MITRRLFLGGSTGLLLGSQLTGLALADPTAAGNRMLFGYQSGAVGSKLAGALLPLLASVGGPGYHLENLEGRNTRLASETAAHAPADGATLLQAIASSLTLLPSVYKASTFDPVHDFTPLACVGEFPYVLAVGGLVPPSVVDLKGYLAWVADNPEYRTIGVAVYGTVGHLAVRTLAAATEAPVRVQPYQNTVGLMSDLRGQSLAAAFIAPGSGVAVGNAAPIRAIGVTSKERLGYWPQVATLAEQGATGMDFTTWFGWFVRASTPHSILQPLRDSVARMQASAQYAEVLRQLLLTPANLTPEQISARMLDETARYKALVDGFHITRFD